MEEVLMGNFDIIVKKFLKNSMVGIKPLFCVCIKWSKYYNSKSLLL